jgi:hypothetical protein
MGTTLRRLRVAPIAHSRYYYGYDGGHWPCFQSSNGPLFDCQSTGEVTKLALFSIIKWPPFGLTKTRVIEPRNMYSCGQWITASSLSGKADTVKQVEGNSPECEKASTEETTGV